MARLVLDDGYTLEGKTEETSGESSGLPIITYRYRPALPDALAEWRYALSRATSGKAQIDASSKLVSEHLVSWDVVDGRGIALPITPDIVRKIGEPILEQIIKTIATWAPKADTVSGNSPTG